MNRYLSIIVCLLSVLLSSCINRSEELARSEELIDQHPDSALMLLEAIDPSDLSDRQLARYALLYTKAQYKNYIDASNDSLISIAVDYYEKNGSEEDKFYAYLYQGIVRYWIADYQKATVSLLRSLRNTDSINDHYSKGQMFTYLALSNSSQQCSDDALYAEMAFQEYHQGNLDNYAASALVTLAVAKLRAQEYDTCRYYLDESIAIAQRMNDDFVMNDALSVKLHYAVCVDSLSLARYICHKLQADSSYQMSARDLAIQAFIAAKDSDTDLAEQLLTMARKKCNNYSDSANYYVMGFWIYRALNIPTKAYTYQDSLLNCEERFLEESLKHTSLAAQRDYIEEQMVISDFRHRIHVYGLTSLIVLSLALAMVLYLVGQKRKMYIRLQKIRIESLLSRLEIQSKTYKEGERMLRLEPFVAILCTSSHPDKCMSSNEWKELHALFSKYIPHFQNSLKELTPLSETEWRVCMLLKLNIAPSSIAILMSKTPGAISSVRERLYKKVFGKRGSTKDWDDFIKSI